MLLLTAVLNLVQGQSDIELRRQAKSYLLLEELHTALYYSNKIVKKTAEDEWLQLELQVLSNPGFSVTAPPRYESKHSAYFMYVLALSEFQHRQAARSLASLKKFSYRFSEKTLMGKVEFLRGKAWLDLDEADSALAHLNLALNLFKTDSLSCYVQIAKVRNSIGNTFVAKEMPEEAIAQYQTALRILQNSPLEKWEEKGKFLNNLAITYDYLGNYTSAQEHYLKAVALKEAHSLDSINRAITYTNVGSFYSDYGNYLKSQQYFELASVLMDTTREQSFGLLGEYFNNYGLLLMSMREYTRASESFLKSLEFHHKAKANRQRLLRPGINLAICLNNADEREQAATVLRQYDSLVRSLPHANMDRVLYWMTRGSIELEEQRADSAQVCYQKAKEALEAFPKIPDRRYTDVLVHLGLVAAKQNNDSLAIYFYHQALARLRKGSMEKEKLITIYNNLGMQFAKHAQRDSAQHYFRLALAENLMEYKHGSTTQVVFVDVFDLITTHYQLAKSGFEKYSKSNSVEDLKQVLPSVQAGLELIKLERDKMVYGVDQIDLSGDVAQFYGMSVMVYFHLYKQTGKQEYFESLFEAVERARQQVMMSSLRIEKIDAFADVTRQVMDQEKEINYTIKHLTAQLSSELALGENATEALVQEYDGALTHEQQKLERLTDSLKYNLPDYYNLKYNKTVVKLSDIQHDVLVGDPAQAIIQYHIIDSVMIIVVNHARKQLAVSVPYTGVKLKVSQVRNQISYHLPEWRKNAVELYNILLKPVEKELKSLKVSELVIIPDQELFFLPFEILSQSDDAPLLIERAEVRYAFSATLHWQKKTDKTIESSSKLFAGFAPVFEKNGGAVQYPLRDGEKPLSFNPLPSTSSEVTQIMKVLKKIQVDGKLYEGEQASEEKFKESDISQYGYLHLATHGFVNMEEPSKSGIAFSKSGGNEDGILFSSEVYNLKLRAELVCLSACETGLGKVYRGEGLLGLGRGFLYAGTKNLLVSLWSVQDQSTSDWMVSFYSELARGSSNSAAVRLAKLKMLKRKSYNHPYYWAPFILVGG